VSVAEAFPARQTWSTIDVSRPSNAAIEVGVEDELFVVMQGPDCGLIRTGRMADAWQHCRAPAHRRALIGLCKRPFERMPAILRRARRPAKYAGDQIRPRRGGNGRTVEHPFANLKYRILDNGRFLLRRVARCVHRNGARGARLQLVDDNYLGRLTTTILAG
jgi:hypothetical protein